MRPSNTVIVRGRIAREIALEQTSGGTPACQLTVAVHRPRQQGPAAETDFIPCRSDGRPAEVISATAARHAPVPISDDDDLPF